ncbi:L-lactate utilization operon repressor [Hartmannibacter diazotrophicus]|uniref:L-lactate utilization operon repressor n=1 Tax=Hartmannibacter diazotrophicus TaxID=1482074 RepID=A0A2C9D2Q8_9HYPH|nr:FCD domain-containing protein [Hartmannibacter diazotrophicus]SON54071.1 L-lactate utilization operon repressor [Hartmannibacter diazotrophicus]
MMQRKKPKLSVRIVAELRRRIESGEIVEGGRLPTEIALVREFGVSRTVIREAVTSLTSDGWVEPRQGAGVFVIRRGDEKKPCPWALQQVDPAAGDDFRLAMEVEAAGLAALRRDASDIEAMRQAQEALAGAGSGEMPPHKADIAFHCAVAAATRNVYFRQVAESLMAMLIRNRFDDEAGTEAAAGDGEWAHAIHAEHEAVIAAIAAGDAEAARAAMQRHLAGCRVRRAGSSPKQCMAGG